MQVIKADYVQFKNSKVYEAARQDVAEAVNRALGEMVNSEVLSEARHSFLRGFIAGATSILEWEPDFVEEQSDDSES